MKLQNELNQEYSKGIVIVHWLTSLLIIILFPLGKYMLDIPVSEKISLIKVHSILGILVFLLTLFRTYLFFKNPQPQHLSTGSKFNDKLIIFIHRAFYILLLAISLTGIAVLIYGSYIELFTRNLSESLLSHVSSKTPILNIHNILATTMIILVVFHVLGVIKHQFSKKENTLKRILP